jgi:hypothetical protein
VGMEGFRVRTIDEYYVVRGLSPSPHMTLPAWRGAGYDEIAVELPDRRFGVKMRNHPPPAPWAAPGRRATPAGVHVLGRHAWTRPARPWGKLRADRRPRR